MLWPLLTIFCSSFVIALSGALMPGPLLTVTVSESTRRGAAAGPLMIVGHGLLELLLVFGLAAGLAPLLSSDEVFTAISLAGGCILCWMGWSMFRELPALRLNPESSTVKGRNLVAAGILLSLANPYWTIWWATIGLGYIAYSITYGSAGIIAFFLGHIGADLAWYSLISLTIARGRHLFSDTIYRVLIGSCAALLICFAGYFFYSGFQQLV